MPKRVFAPLFAVLLSILLPFGAEAKDSSSNTRLLGDPRAEIWIECASVLPNGDDPSGNPSPMLSVPYERVKGWQAQDYLDACAQLTLAQGQAYATVTEANTNLLVATAAIDGAVENNTSVIIEEGPDGRRRLVYGEAADLTTVFQTGGMPFGQALGASRIALGAHTLQQRVVNGAFDIKPGAEAADPNKKEGAAPDPGPKLEPPPATSPADTASAQVEQLTDALKEREDQLAAKEAQLNAAEQRLAETQARAAAGARGAALGMGRASAAAHQ